jgi:alanine racemase
MGHVAQKPLTIATVPLGHADGISRQYGKGVGFMYVNEQKAKIVGNVCMDMLMIDVSGIDCEIGDSVVVFNNKHSAEDLAHAAGTISYELITGITTRVKRVFKS